MNHTPGPWIADCKHPNGTHEVRETLSAPAQINRGFGDLVARIEQSDSFHDGGDEGRANARLIAAAPDLLDSLIQATAYLHDIVNHESRDMAISAAGAEIELGKAEAAIDKATK